MRNRPCRVEFSQNSARLGSLTCLGAIHLCWIYYSDRYSVMNLPKFREINWAATYFSCLLQ